MKGYAVRNSMDTVLFVFPNKESIDKEAIVRILKAGGLRNISMDDHVSEHA